LINRKTGAIYLSPSGGKAYLSPFRGNPKPDPQRPGSLLCDRSGTGIASFDDLAGLVMNQEL